MYYVLTLFCDLFFVRLLTAKSSRKTTTAITAKKSVLKNKNKNSNKTEE